jgi:adenylate kinase
VDLLIFGPQGAGKGTQAVRISREYNVPHIASGDMLRAAIAAGTALGMRVKAVVESGVLVTDELMIELIRERLGADDAAGGFVLDGFPRTMAQAEALDAMLEEIGRGVDVAIVLQIDDGTARERLLRRAALEGRIDDTPAVIDTRLRTYHEETAPIVEWYRARDKLVPIDGTQDVDGVYAQIRQALDRAAQRGMRASA